MDRLAPVSLGSDTRVYLWFGLIMDRTLVQLVSHAFTCTWTDCGPTCTSHLIPDAGLTDMDQSRVKKVIELLRAVANDNVSPDAALKEWPLAESETQGLLAAAWHHLSHYQVDADIRARDPVYAAYQVKRLLEYASRLEEAYDASSGTSG